MPASIFEFIWAVRLSCGVGSYEGIKNGTLIHNPGDDGELSHVHLEPLGIVHLGNQSQVCYGHLIIHTELAWNVFDAGFDVLMMYNVSNKNVVMLHFISYWTENNNK